ncbi:UNVERIFIED_ORG: hypothetical protein ABIC43_007461 [Variovorax guangxiensis]
MKTRLFFAALATAALVACGGGGGGGGNFGSLPVGWVPPSPGPGAGPSPEPNPEPNPNPTPTPTPIAASYKFLKFEQNRDPDTESAEKRFNDYIALLNREGAAGYRYLEGEAGGTIVRLQDSFMLVKDTESTYSYEYKRLTYDILQTTALQALLQQAKEQGAKGMVLLKILAPIDLNSNLDPEFAVLYRKDLGSSATYDVTAELYAENVADYVSRANAQGANGYRPWATPFLVNQGGYQFFLKDLGSASRYHFKAVISPLSVVGGELKDVKAQIREQGAQGYRLLKDRFLKDANGESKDYIYYVKDTTQSSSFEYEFLDNPDPVFGLQEANAAQANAQTANGLRYFGVPDSPIFFRSSACTGPLCLSPDRTETSDRN